MKMAKEQEEDSSNNSKTYFLAAATSAGNCVMVPLSIMSGSVSAPLGAVAGVSGLVSSVYVMKQSSTLKNSASVFNVNGRIRAELNRMKAEHKKLQMEVAMLEESVSRLKEVDEALAVMAEQQGTDMNRLMELVEENRKTRDEMKILMKGELCQNMISIMLKCDDGDFRLDDREIDILCLRLAHIDGVKFHERKMRSIIKARKGDLMAVVGVVRDLLKNNPYAPKVFSFEFDDSDDNA